MTNTSKGTDADGKPISFTIVYDSSKRNQVGDSIVERPAALVSLSLRLDEPSRTTSSSDATIDLECR